MQCALKPVEPAQVAESVLSRAAAQHAALQKLLRMISPIVQLRVASQKAVPSQRSKDDPLVVPIPALCLRSGRSGLNDQNGPPAKRRELKKFRYLKVFSDQGQSLITVGSCVAERNERATKHESQGLWRS